MSSARTRPFASVQNPVMGRKMMKLIALQHGAEGSVMKRDRSASLSARGSETSPETHILCGIASELLLRASTVLLSKLSRRHQSVCETYEL